MRTAIRITAAVAVGCIQAGVCAVLSYRLDTPHIIPGCLVAFGMGVLTVLVMPSVYRAGRAQSQRAGNNSTQVQIGGRDR